MTNLNLNLFKSMMIEAVNTLNEKKDYLNYINVFPVRDGDTGNNLFNTLKNSVLIARKSLRSFLKDFKNQLLLNARGNSGVIISQFFKGFSDCLIKVNEVGVREFAEAIEEGFKSAYQSVSKPVEGTMLTVLKGASIGAKTALNKAHSIKDVLLNSFNKAKEYLKQTVNQLPILENSGVVDSGGLGIIYLLNAWLKALGVKLLIDKELEQLKVINLNKGVNKSYCVNVLISDCTQENALKELLNKLGDSLIIAKEDNLIRVHMHSDDYQSVKIICESLGKIKKFSFDDLKEEYERITN